jgi:hypothetical protein
VIMALGARHTNTQLRAVQKNGRAVHPLRTNEMAFSSSSERVAFEDHLDSGLDLTESSRMLHNIDFHKLCIVTCLLRNAAVI